MITYWSYLKADTLLNLQTGIDSHEGELLPGEVQFILVHQVFELWFKLILQELRLGRDSLLQKSKNTLGAIARFQQVRDTFLIAADHWKLLSGLSPQDFLAFRDKLFPASGFQSFQFAEIEIILGLETALALTGSPPRQLAHIRLAAQATSNEHIWTRIENARKEETVRRSVYDYLYPMPLRGSKPGMANDAQTVIGFLNDYEALIQEYYDEQIAALAKAPQADLPAIRRRFLERRETGRRFLFAEDIPEPEREYYRRVRAVGLILETTADSAISEAKQLINAMLALEDSVLRWRTNHVRLVERIIGRRIGTGGSSGVDYLEKTINYRVFGDLWAVRTEVIPDRYSRRLV